LPFRGSNPSCPVCSYFSVRWIFQNVGKALHRGTSLQNCSFGFQLLTARFLWNPKCHYRIHMNPPLGHVLSDLNPVHTFTGYCIKARFDIVLPFMPRSSKWSLYLTKMLLSCFVPYISSSLISPSW